MFEEEIQGLLLAAEAKEPNYRGHAERVAKYALAIADELRLSVFDKLQLEQAAFLHDIGLVGVRQQILVKTMPLTEREFQELRRHPIVGAKILQPIPSLSELIPAVKYHHERWAGGGYPEGLQGEQIPVLARIITVAEAFDAMTTNRCYRKALSHKEALSELKCNAGTQFDPQIVDAFLEAQDEEKV